jgi:hypothetical protein
LSEARRARPCPSFRTATVMERTLRNRDSHGADSSKSRQSWSGLFEIATVMERTLS